MDALYSFLGRVMELCFRLCGSYGLAVTLFTLLTKIILLPVSVWMQRNSIAMVRLTPELNRLKLKYYGDKDAVAEQQQALYRREHYHPLLGVVPMFIQLLLLLGVIGAVRQMLAGTGSLLSVYPIHLDGIRKLGMPLAAGVSALALGLAQNRLNPLQREQTRAGQLGTNGLSIAISLTLGAFVPMGVGLYWICSNLFTILQQLLLNAIAPPEKYIDYAVLEESRKALSGLDSLGGKVSPEDRKRERADYKRFFSVANKHLVFYSEKSGFYKYFQDVIEELLRRSNVTIHYVTSDPGDRIFETAKQQPRIRPYYIGEKKLITLMMKMDADMVVMTMPDLDNFHIKRSYVRKDIEYVYMFHGIASTNMVVRKGCFDNYDTLLCVGPHQVRELREAENMYGMPARRLVECGYDLIAKRAAEYAGCEHLVRETPSVVIAPSWQPDNILDSCLDPLVEAVKSAGVRITIRPHPEYIKRFPNRTEAICSLYGSGSPVLVDLDFSHSIQDYDLLITDWSTVAYEFSFITLKPALFINTPPKVLNEEYVRYSRLPADISWRDKAGMSLDMDKLDKAGVAVRDLLLKSDAYVKSIDSLRREAIFNFDGGSGAEGARYILGVLSSGAKARRSGTD